MKLISFLNVWKKVKFLGIVFEKNKPAQNIEDKQTTRNKRIESLIKTWSRRDLSIHGKITIEKFFLISQLVIVIETIGLPEKNIKRN